jgi:calpain-7
MISRSGKYVLRLNFNGCWRRVEIDDLLPTSTNSRILHVINRSNPGLLWPALVEKAYLKVRGGYDFPGSNSGTDLALLTGWIPQQIFLHDEEVERDGLWTRVLHGFQNGDLLLTMGTGKLPDREQRLLGLAAEHDYAVLNMKESNGVREMLIKNPWSDGDVWRGAARRRPRPSHESTAELNSAEQDVTQDHTINMTPGTFWMSFDIVFQHFENLYLNWNPGLFSIRQDMHFSWDLSATDRLPGLFIDHPQFTINSPQGGEIWLLLSKHLRTGDYTHQREGRNGYISLYIYDRNGGNVISSDGAKLRGPLVDSPNTLLIFSLPAKGTFTAVVASEDLPVQKYNFTLSAFSNMPVSLAEAASRYQYEWTVPAAWTRGTAGGNSDTTSYLTNPQFSVTAQFDHHVAVVLRVSNSQKENQAEIHAKILVVASDGRRVTRLRPRDIVAHSGDYRRATAVVETHLAKGKYTIICSTFERDQYAKFTLTLHTSSQQSASLRALPAENSGRLSMSTTPAIFEPETSRLLAPITLTKVTRAIFILQNAVPPFDKAKNMSTTSLFKMTLEQDQGPYKKTLASSAFTNIEFANVNTGVRIEDTDLLPAMHGHGFAGLWLVLERLEPTSSEQQRNEVLKVEVLSDERIDIGPWGHGEG